MIKYIIPFFFLLRLVEVSFAEKLDVPPIFSEIVAIEGVTGLENFYRFHHRVYGGSGPYKLEHFEQLRRKGIKIVLSVDGAMPKVDLAESCGMRYIHIPMGYDGVADDVKFQLARAYLETEGALYVHCHHGKHRSPAAVGSMLVGAGLMEPEGALAVLEKVGTSKEYAGLYRDVANSRVVSEAEIAQAAPLVSIASISDFTQSMAVIDVNWDNIKLSRKADWRLSDEHPDIDPSHEALMLHEQFRELLRSDEANEYSVEEAESLAEFKRLLVEAVELSGELEEGLQEQESVEVIEHRFLNVKQNCKSCHELYRN